MRPVICAITDRHRLSTTGDSSADRVRLDALVAQVHTLGMAGVHLVQIRERDLDGRALFDLVTRCTAAVRGTGTRIVVNDRLDVAIAAGAHGVHLRGDSFPAVRARAIVPRGFVVGRSVHDADEARRTGLEGGVDYLLFAPVYETASKPGVAPAGLDALRATTRATTIPVLALGGITLDRLASIRAAGAQGFAAIGLFSCDAGNLRTRIAHAAAAFDTPPADS